VQPDFGLGDGCGRAWGAVSSQVRIFSPSRVASQQGKCNTGFFKLQFEMTPKYDPPCPADKRRLTLPCVRETRSVCCR
jgi:hypothetical protein